MGKFSPLIREEGEKKMREKPTREEERESWNVCMKFLKTGQKYKAAIRADNLISTGE